ncbi:MAG: hypothetical protein NTNFB02_17420 [Nitrospira sp.]
MNIILSMTLALIFLAGIVKTLTGTVQAQVEKQVKATVKGLLEGTTKPQDLPRRGKELLGELFGR